MSIASPGEVSLEYELAARQTASAAVRMARVLGIDGVVPRYDGFLAGDALHTVMAAWTGAEHVGAQSEGIACGEVTDTLDGLFPLSAVQEPTSNPDVLIEIGAGGDVMRRDAETQRQWLEKGYRPGTIWYLAGMRALGRTMLSSDIKLLQALDVPEEEWPRWTETDLARAVILNQLGGSLVRRTHKAGPITEVVVPELGPRRFTHEYYQTEVGVPVVLHNCGAVQRDGGGVPRHTSRSGFKELLATGGIVDGTRVSIMALQPHAQRIAAELMVESLRIGKPIQLAQVHAQPPTRMHDRIRLSALPPLHRASAELVSSLHRHDLTKILSPETAAQSGLDADTVLAGMRDRMINALDLVYPRLVTEGASVREGLEALLGKQTERRADAVEPLFANEEAKMAFIRLVKELGLGVETSITPDDLGIEGPYLFYSEGGTAIKMKKQLDDLLLSVQAKPSAIILGGAQHRSILASDVDPYCERQKTAQLLGIHEHEVGATEYDVHRQLAEQYLVHDALERPLEFSYDIESGRVTRGSEQSQFTLLGYSVDGAPVILMNQDRLYAADGTYRALGTEGTFKVLRGLLDEGILANHARQSTPDIRTVVYGTSFLYAPTRVLGLLQSRRSATQEGSGIRMAVSMYGGKDPSLARLGSELNYLLRAMLADSPATR